MLIHFIVAADVARSRGFYVGVLGCASRRPAAEVKAVRPTGLGSAGGS
jgi:hypothetical protein